MCPDSGSLCWVGMVRERRPLPDVAARGQSDTREQAALLEFDDLSDSDS